MTSALRHWLSRKDSGRFPVWRGDLLRGLTQAELIPAIRLLPRRPVEFPMLRNVTSIIDYSSPGPLTALEGIDSEAFAGLGESQVAICTLVHALVIQPGDAESMGLPLDRLASNQVRAAVALIDELLRLDSAPLVVPRDATKRVVGTCRHFAVISCALLRQRGYAARVRCGFATYFQPGQGLDHWITEYWNSVDARWVRIDSEILGGQILTHPEDLRPGDFLSGGEAWSAFQQGTIDAATFGVYGTANWGAAEIRGNVVKDLAALNKVEMLPWDEWGRMTDAYKGETGPDYDELLDEIATACAVDDPRAIAALYEHADLKVPPNMIC